MTRVVLRQSGEVKIITNWQAPNKLAATRQEPRAKWMKASPSQGCQQAPSRGGNERRFSGRGGRGGRSPPARLTVVAAPAHHCEGPAASRPTSAPLHPSLAHPATRSVGCRAALPRGGLLGLRGDRSGGGRGGEGGVGGGRWGAAGSWREGQGPASTGGGNCHWRMSALEERS